MPRFVASLTLILSLSAPACGQGELPEGWIFFTSKEGGFLVAFPGKPRHSKQKVATATGQLDANVFVVEEAGDSAYVASYVDMPEEDVKKGGEQRRLDFARDGAVSSLRGKLRSEKKIEVSGVPARDIVVDGKNGLVVRMRILAAGRRVYQVMAMGQAGFGQGQEGRPFLDSFRLNR